MLAVCAARRVQQRQKLCLHAVAVSEVVQLVRPSCHSCGTWCTRIAATTSASWLAVTTGSNTAAATTCPVPATTSSVAATAGAVATATRSITATAGAVPSPTRSGATRVPSTYDATTGLWYATTNDNDTAAILGLWYAANDDVAAAVLGLRCSTNDDDTTTFLCLRNSTNDDNAAAVLGLRCSTNDDDTTTFLCLRNSTNDDNSAAVLGLWYHHSRHRPSRIVASIAVAVSQLCFFSPKRKSIFSLTGVQ